MSFVSRSPMAPDFLAPLTLTGLVERTEADYPDRPALLSGDEVVTYRELLSRSRHLACGLAQLGIGRGDVVAAQVPNGVAFVALYLATTRLGAALQTLHMPYRAAELDDLLRQSGAKAVVALSQFKAERPAAVLLDLADGLPARPRVIALGPEAPDGALAFETLVRTPDTAPADAARPDHPMLLLYTSGTTASPKGVANAHAGFLANARASAAAFELGPEDVILSLAPFTHLYGAFALHLALVSGAATATLPAFSPAEFVACLRRTRATAIFAAPAHFAATLAAGLIDAETFGCVRTICVSGSPVAADLAATIETAVPSCRVVQLWGMSELQAGSYGRPSDPAELRHHSAGRPSPGTELRIVDDGGLGLDAGLEGRLQMRGPSLFSGYRHNPDATAAAFPGGGWFDTGDTGYLRPDGALVLTGRVKEIINRGGVKFSPVDAEMLIERMDSVSRAAIVAMPDPILGERAALFVVPADGAAPTLAEVTAHLDAAGIARFKWPERLELLSEMPMTPTQKVMRGRLAGILAERMRSPPT